MTWFMLRLALKSAVVGLLVLAGMLFVIGLLVWLDYQFGIRCCA